MIPINIPLPSFDQLDNIIELPITWQIPTIILLTIIFKRKIVYKAFTIYIVTGLLIIPVFHQGGSLGYLLTANFGYLLGIYPLIKIIDKLNKKNRISIINFLRYGFLAISVMHLSGICYNFIQTLFYDKFNLFFFNVGKYSLGKIGYHLFMLIPLVLFIKPIRYLRFKLND